MKVNFIGLTGPMGVLPHCYTELIRDRNRAKDYGLQDFFDLFNHRMISLFYQAWEKYRFFVAYEREEEDRFSRYLMSFVGLGTTGLQHRQTVLDESFCSTAACSRCSRARRSRSNRSWRTTSTCRWRSSHTWAPGTPWIPTTSAAWRRSVPYSDQIGLGAIAGDEIWDRQSRARIKLGPLAARQYLSFLPAGDAWEPLRAITTFFSGGEIEFEIQLMLKRDEVPAANCARAGETAPLLGWVSWIKSGPAFARDPGDTVLLLN
jgi:type VI secretion system protein ImpH